MIAKDSVKRFIKIQLESKFGNTIFLDNVDCNLIHCKFLDYNILHCKQKKIALTFVKTFNKNNSGWLYLH